MFLALRGRVKGEHSADACHLILIAATIETGLKPRLWVGRMIEAYRTKGITDGWVFRNEIGTPGRQSDYKRYFFVWFNISRLVVHLLPDYWTQKMMYQLSMG
jgi:hypothetical protein